MNRKFPVIISTIAMIMIIGFLIVPAVRADTNTCCNLETKIGTGSAQSSAEHSSGFHHLLDGSPDKAGSCSRCNGTGKCQVCGGTGTINEHECSVCNGTGKCHYCDGDGELWN